MLPAHEQWLAGRAATRAALAIRAGLRAAGPDDPNVHGTEEARSFRRWFTDTGAQATAEALVLHRTRIKDAPSGEDVSESIAAVLELQYELAKDLRGGQVTQAEYDAFKNDLQAAFGLALPTDSE